MLRFKIIMAMVYFVFSAEMAFACVSHTGPLARTNDRWIIVKSADPNNPQQVSSLIMAYDNHISFWNCTEILKSSNGMLALTIGTIERGRSQSFLDTQRGNGIPADSFISDGTNMVARVPVATLLAQTPGALPSQSPAGRAPLLVGYDRTALREKFRTESQARERAYLQFILSNIIEDRRPGLVYKSAEFWDRYPKFASARNMFAGNWSEIPGIFSVAQVYYNFVHGFDEVCSAHWQRPLWTFTVTEVDEFDIPTRIGEISRVNMSEPFIEHFERMYNRRASGQKFDALRAIGRAITGENRENPLSIGIEILATVVDIQTSYNSMVLFLSEQGCTSATVQQMKEQVLRIANNQSPVQDSRINFEGALTESEPWGLRDAQEYLDLVRRHLAANPKSDVEGHFLMREELEDHDHDWLWRKTPRLPQARDVSRAMEEQGVLMIRCVYGPIGFLRDGSAFDTVEHFFTYAVEPPNFDIFVQGYLGLQDVYRGRFHVVSECPTNSAKALALLQSIP